MQTMATTMARARAQEAASAEKQKESAPFAALPSEPVGFSENPIQYQYDAQVARQLDEEYRQKLAAEEDAKAREL
jgi:hypothetical protein